MTTPPQLEDMESPLVMRGIAALIERVEKATGPDRELDAAIEAHFCAGTVAGVADNCEAGTYWFQPKGQFGRSLRSAQQLTASLDTVVALVEREFDDLPTLAHGYEKGHGAAKMPYTAYVSRNYVSTGHWYREAYHITPALALLLAFLRAYSASKPSGHHPTKEGEAP